jgi:hypothetical protein
MGLEVSADEGFSLLFRDCLCGTFYLLEIVGFLVADVLTLEKMQFCCNSANGSVGFLAEEFRLTEVYIWVTDNYYF